MSKKGGYQIIDLQNKNLVQGEPGIVFEGMYDSIEGTNKAVLVSGLVINGVAMQDCFGYVEKDGNMFQIAIYNANYYVVVEDNDVVSVE